MTSNNTRRSLRVAAAVTAVTISTAGLALVGALPATADEVTTPAASTEASAPTTTPTDTTADGTDVTTTPAVSDPAPSSTPTDPGVPTADPTATATPSDPTSSPVTTPPASTDPTGTDPAPTFVAPVPSFNVTITKGLHVQVDASSTTPGSDPITDYSWHFGDGYSTGGANSGSTANYDYPAYEAGTYTITLVETSGGQQFSTTREVSVAPVAPVADFTFPYNSNLVVIADGSSTQVGQNQNVAYTWDFGDGTIVTNSGYLPSHAYATPGTYPVTLTATTQYGSDSITKNVTVTSTSVTTPTPPTAPVAKFYIGEQKGLWVVLVDSGDADPNKYNVFWDFGDGDTHGGTIGKHAYAKAGTYTVTMTVQSIDDPTNETVTTQNVTVTADAASSPGTGTGTGGGSGTPIADPTPIVTIPAPAPVALPGTAPAAGAAATTVAAATATPDKLAFTGSEDAAHAAGWGIFGIIAGAGLIVLRRRGRNRSV